MVVITIKPYKQRWFKQFIFFCHATPTDTPTAEAEDIHVIVVCYSNKYFKGAIECKNLYIPMHSWIMRVQYMENTHHKPQTPLFPYCYINLVWKKDDRKICRSKHNIDCHVTLGSLICTPPGLFDLPHFLRKKNNNKTISISFKFNTTYYIWSILNLVYQYHKLHFHYHSNSAKWNWIENIPNRNRSI